MAIMSDFRPRLAITIRLSRLLLLPAPSPLLLLLLILSFTAVVVSDSVTLTRCLMPVEAIAEEFESGKQERENIEEISEASVGEEVKGFGFGF